MAISDIPDFSKLVPIYKKAQWLGVSFNLDYNEEENNWCFEITSPTSGEDFYRKNLTFNEVTDYVLKHLEILEKRLNREE